MVSQRSMHRTNWLACGRILLGAALLLGGACSQGEGERCQIDSDCSGDLVCPNGASGNGICTSRNSGNDDAAVTADARDVANAEVPADTRRADVAADGGLRSDVTSDLPPFTPVDADVATPDAPAGLPDLAIDTASVDGPTAPPVDAQAIDGTSVDGGAIDTRAIDTLPID
jgi:hypothetical protein